jgi:curli biogenesis system outer membrane secretion channel CsgG
MRTPFCAGLSLLVLLLTGCAPSATVTKGGGATIGEAQAEQYDGPKARIAVGTIIDKSGATPLNSLSYQLSRMPVSDSNLPAPDANGVLSGIRDMLTTALFQSNRYIVLERATLSDVLVEQEFSASGKVGEASRIPMGQIEGAELLVVGALTAFNPGIAGGVGFPVPIPLNKRGDMAILDVQMRKGYAAMDLRVIDTRTARIVASVAVEGSSYKFGAAVSGIASTRSGSVRLPVILRGFTNTPAERAISEMVDAAVANIVEKTPPVYFHYDLQDSGTKTAPATNSPAR